MDKDVVGRGTAPCQLAGPDFRHFRSASGDGHKARMIMPSSCGAAAIASVLSAPYLLTMRGTSEGGCA